MDLEIRPLDERQTRALGAGLDFAARIADAPRPLSVQAIETLYNGLLDKHVDDADAIVALGLSFGATFLDHGAFEWVRVTDEFGEETCVAVVGKSLFCAPVSMIQKRLKDGERPDIRLLRDETIRRLLELAEEAGERRA